MREETLQAAREAWKNDPEAACMALLGKSSEEVFIEALRGCNQHRHKPGCPDADGSGEGGANKESKPKFTEQDGRFVQRMLKEPNFQINESTRNPDTARLVKIHSNVLQMYKNATKEKMEEFLQKRDAAKDEEEKRYYERRAADFKTEHDWAERNYDPDNPNIRSITGGAPTTYSYCNKIRDMQDKIDRLAYVR